MSHSAIGLADAESVLTELASVFFQGGSAAAAGESAEPNVEARYRALVEQIPAVVFMAYLDRGIGEAYVSPQIERSLGFSQSEWLEDPVRWYRHIHPDDKQRWSVEAAEMFLTGKPLRSSYRVIARDGHVVWFHCEAKMIRRPDGRPWFIHGVAFDITGLKQVEQALEDERNVLSAILDTAGALVIVFDPNGRIVRFNRACEEITGYTFAEVKGKRTAELFLCAAEVDPFEGAFAPVREHQGHWVVKNGARRLIRWQSTILHTADRKVRHVIATGVDITERKRLEEAVLEASGSEQRRIGHDLHDGLGQHLTGIAFMAKVLEQTLAEKDLPESAEAAKIVNLVNEAIHKARVLARGLTPVLSDSGGLMSALQQWASEVEDLFRIRCLFDCEEPVLLDNAAAANHLYRIAQEAVHNAIKHGKAKNIRIGLCGGDMGGVLTVEDDGSGIANDAGNGGGMGLHIMRYRAGMVGGVLRVERRVPQGTLVACLFRTGD